MIRLGAERGVEDAAAEFRVGGVGPSRPAAGTAGPVESPPPPARARSQTATPRLAELRQSDVVEPRAARRRPTRAAPSRLSQAPSQRQRASKGPGSLEQLATTIDGAAWQTAFALSRGEEPAQTGAILALEGAIQALRDRGQDGLAARAGERFAEALDAALRTIASVPDVRGVEIPAELEALIRRAASEGRHHWYGNGLTFSSHMPRSCYDAIRGLEQLALQDPAAATAAQRLFESLLQANRGR